MKNELDLSSYGTKAGFKKGTSAYTLEFAKTIGLACLKSKADKLDIDKLETTPADLSKLSDTVKN